MGEGVMSYKASRVSRINVLGCSTVTRVSGEESDQPGVSRLCPNR